MVPPAALELPPQLPAPVQSQPAPLGPEDRFTSGDSPTNLPRSSPPAATSELWLAQVVNQPAPSAAVPPSIQSKIDGLRLPEGRYAADLRIEGGVSANDDGDITARGELSYRDRQIAAVLAGELSVDVNPADGSRQTEVRIGGGIVIGLGEPNRDAGVVAAQNQIVSDLGRINDEARNLAYDIAENPELDERQRARALRDLGNQVTTQLLEGLMAVQNSEEGSQLPEALVEQLALRLDGPFGTNGALEVINAELEALGEPPFPVATTREAVQRVAGLVEEAGANTVRDNTAPPRLPGAGTE